MIAPVHRADSFLGNFYLKKSALTRGGIHLDGAAVLTDDGI
jgi:hypothetical protein